MMYKDINGKNPLSGAVIKELILGEDFLVAWWTVCVYILKMDVSDFHMKLMKHRLSDDNTLTMAGRGFGKSYVLTTAYILTHILRDINISIAVVTRVERQSTDFVNELKNFFEKGAIIYNIFGNLKGDEWSSLQFSLKRDINRLEKTVTACSVGSPSSLVSKHYDIILLDDCVNGKTSSTKNMRDKTEESIYNEILPAMHPMTKYGYIHVVGTHFHPDDIYSRLEKKGSYSVLKVPALIKNKSGELVSIWKGIPQKTLDRVLKIKNDNPLAFRQQYQQIVMKNSGSIFKPEWIQYFSKYNKEKDGIYVHRISDEGEEKREKVRVYMGVDLAISMKQSADSFVICTIGIGAETGYIYLLDMYRGKLSFNEQIEKIKEVANKWDTVERIGIESVAYQQALPGELIRTTMLPVVKVQAITDKVTRMNKFSGQWENSKVFLYNHIQDLHVLEEETLSFPEAEHDDTIDAFEIAFQTVQKSGTDTTKISRDMFNFI